MGDAGEGLVDAESRLAERMEEREQEKRKARQAAKGDYIAPPLIMKSWTFGIMTDLWGDIPYTEANLGADGPWSPRRLMP